MQSGGCSSFPHCGCSRLFPNKLLRAPVVSCRGWEGLSMMDILLLFLTHIHHSRPSCSSCPSQSSCNPYRPLQLCCESSPLCYWGEQVALGEEVQKSLSLNGKTSRPSSSLERKWDQPYSLGLLPYSDASPSLLLRRSGLRASGAAAAICSWLNAACGESWLPLTLEGTNTSADELIDSQKRFKWSDSQRNCSL